MKMGGRKSLAKGQIWQTRTADIEIVKLGRRRIQYRVTSQLGQKRVSAQISAIEPMQKYLENNAAHLVASAD